jgi:predicted RNase H-like nuclease (RuvC/YqgF family)
LRDTYEKQTKDNQEEFAKIYENKIKNLQNGLDTEKVSKAGREQEVREMITKVSALTSRNVELEGSNSSLQKRMAELQKEMDELAAHMRAQMAAKDAEVRNKDDQMDAMTKDYKVRTLIIYSQILVFFK